MKGQLKIIDQQLSITKIHCSISKSLKMIAACIQFNRCVYSIQSINQLVEPIASNII
jgi:hypothetical protein